MKYMAKRSAGFFLAFFLLFLGFAGCGGGGGGDNTSPQEIPPTIKGNDLIISEVIGDGPIIAMASKKDGSEAIGVIGERDTAGNPIKVTGAVYISDQGDAGILEVGPDGLPLSMEDSAGNTAIFSNYTDSSVVRPK